MSFTLLPRSRVIFRWATLSAQASRNLVARYPTYQSGVALTSRALTARAVPALRKCGYATVAKKAAKPRTAAKRTTGRAKPARKTATAKRTTAKKTGRKTVKKAKKAIKKKAAKPKKRGLTERQKLLLQKKKAREMIAALKEKALTAPTKLPDSPMALYIKENVSGGANFTEVARRYKSISMADAERYTKLAATNRQLNANAYKNWHESLTPLQIKEANSARRRLSTLLKNYSYRPIHDTRTVTRPRTPWVLFFKDHFAAQAQANEKSSQTMTRISKIWRNLSNDEKEKYLSMARADHDRYMKEFKHAYGKEPLVAGTTA
ncbi:hypothetical protein KEM54_006111 [Ascosphaera aggregata]|nr:hypothetical protein KEM54_006111 [Ascosphaera aggregata]